jgi:hypothetical protein
VATDIAPDAEASLRRFVKAAWPALERLVARFIQNEGYRRFSLMRASEVVKRQLALA